MPACEPSPQAARDSASITDAPEELARVALSHLGVDRRLEALETGRGSLDRLVEQLGGSDVSVARTLGELRLLTR